MPQLPSGRHVLLESDLEPVLHHGRRSPDVEAIRRPTDLFPCIKVSTLRPATAEEYTVFRTKELSEGSRTPPPGLVPEATGYTLADVSALTRDWPESDSDALRDMLEGERFKTFLGGLFDQFLLHSGRRMDAFIDRLLTDPELRELYMRADD